MLLCDGLLANMSSLVGKLADIGLIESSAQSVWLVIYINITTNQGWLAVMF